MKTYMTPSLKELTIMNSEVLCVSGGMPADPGTDVDGGWVRKGGWNAENWTETEED